MFLPRHARRAGAAAAPGGGAARERAGAALAGAALSNGLEAKISCANSKVSYVLDTEDVLWRRGARRQGGGGGGGGAPCPDGARAGKYRAWLAAREEALRPGFGPYAAGAAADAPAAAAAAAAAAPEPAPGPGPEPMAE